VDKRVDRPIEQHRLIDECHVNAFRENDHLRIRNLGVHLFGQIRIALVMITDDNRGRCMDAREQTSPRPKPRGTAGADSDPPAASSNLCPV
jgi:hypothetical protein